MNKATRQLIVVQNKVTRLTVDLRKLQDKGLPVSLLSRRVEEIQNLKDSVGLK